MESLRSLPLSWVDWSMVGVLGISLLFGLMRGFVFELLSLAGWIVAWMAAQWTAPMLAPALPVVPQGGGLSHGIAFAVAFVAALIIWALLARLVRMLIHATPLSVIDRLLGAGFGVLRGMVILLAVATLVGMSPAAKSELWQTSQVARILDKTLQALKPLLPESAARWLPA